MLASPIYQSRSAKKSVACITTRGALPVCWFQRSSFYNEPKVKEGRSKCDLYDRLREDIDRSRQMYDKRVAPPVAARHDYFHQELVNMLAEGDQAKLGAAIRAR